MIRLALLRHGPTAWNRAGRIQGRTDIALDPEAEAALAALRLPPPWNRARIVSSPLLRARRTAELLTGAAPAIEPALTEMDWGDWEGRHSVELDGDPDCDYRPVDDWGWVHAPPGGESAGALRARVTAWAGTLREDTLAVTHIGVMRVLLAHAHGWDFAGPAPFRIKRNRLYVIEISAAGWHALADPLPLREAAP